MHKKSWKVIGPVTVKAYNGSSESYPNLREAVKAVGGRNIDRLTYGRLGYRNDWYYDRPAPEYTFTWIYARSQPAVRGDSFIFIDELGFTIPVWKVKEVYASHVEKPVRQHYYRGYKSGRWGSWYRHPLTRGYWRDWAAIEDEDLSDVSDHLVSRLKKGKPNHRDNPVVWDELIRGSQRDRSWKNYRKTQYKS